MIREVFGLDSEPNVSVVMAEGLKLAVTLVYGRICDIYFYF